jgi:hypothetical protein
MTVLGRTKASLWPLQPHDLVSKRRERHTISGVGSIAILVHDANKSAEWYHDKLGFEFIGTEGHAVFVKPNGSQAPMLHLFVCSATKIGRVLFQFVLVRGS